MNPIRYLFIVTFFTYSYSSVCQTDSLKRKLDEIFFNLPLDSSFLYIANYIKNDSNLVLGNETDISNYYMRGHFKQNIFNVRSAYNEFEIYSSQNTFDTIINYGIYLYCNDNNCNVCEEYFFELVEYFEQNSSLKEERKSIYLSIYRTKYMFYYRKRQHVPYLSIFLDKMFQIDNWSRIGIIYSPECFNLTEQKNTNRIFKRNKYKTNSSWFRPLRKKNKDAK